MGIREQGYRHWDGNYTSLGTRWWTITKQGLRATVFNRWRLVGMLLLTFLVWAPYFAQGLASFLGGANTEGFECVQKLKYVDGEFRAVTPDQALRCNLYDLLRGWEFLIVPVFITMIAVPLVTSDLRSNAMYIYLSKPVRRMDYIIGKATAVMILALPVTLLPNLFVWLMAISSSTKFSKVQEPFEILFELLFVQAIFVLVMTVVPLAVASFTKNGQVAFFGYLGGYFGLWFVAAIIVDETRQRGWFYMNIVHNLVNFAQDVWDVRGGSPPWLPSFLILLAIIAGGLGVFIWRILKLEVAE